MPSLRSSLIVLFAVYLVLLAWVILWKLEVPFVGAAAGMPRPIKLIPFLPTADADASAPLEVLANVLLFLPFGVYLALLAPGWRWWQALGVFAGSSLALELAQHLLSTGTFDVTDLITNTAGGMLGLGLIALARRRLTAATLTRALGIATAVAVVAVAVFIASPVRYESPRDVILTTPTAIP